MTGTVNEFADGRNDPDMTQDELLKGINTISGRLQRARGLRAIA